MTDMTTQSAYLPTFLEISAELTGFEQVELQATGMSDSYLQTILTNNSADNVAAFFTEAELILARTRNSETAREAQIRQLLMPASSYLGLARNIIILWYTGQWNAVQVGPDSYIESLMWPAGQTHPPGAKQPGYGSWSTPPLTGTQTIHFRNNPVA
jgi:hypothetical protein